MTTLESHAPGTTPGVAPSVLDWLTSADHKRIGRLYTVTGMVLLAAVGVVGLLLSLDRADTTRSLLGEGAVAQAFSAYRVGLVWAALAALVVGVAVAVVPLQLGARALAFPRLAMAGFWLWLVGTALTIISIAANGGPGGGRATFVALFLSAHIIQIAGLIATLVTLVTTILTTRAPGMNMRRVPMFTWSVLVAALGLLVTLPVVLGNAIVTYVDYRYGRNAFGGNRGVLDMIGSGLTQPVTILWAIPAFGFAIEAVATATRNRLAQRGAVFTGVGLLGVGAFAAVTQTDLGLPRNAFDQSFGAWLGDLIPFAFFVLLPVLGGLVVLAVGALNLKLARPRVLSPLVFGLLGAGLVFAGVVANAVYNIGDAQLPGTVFEEAVTLLVVYGAALAMLGALVYWGPKLTGFTVDDRKLVPVALLGALGVALAAGPYLIAGFAKQPGYSTVFAYGGPYQLWNIVSAVGHVLMVLTVVGVLTLHLGAPRAGQRAGDDPWDGQTLEWATSSPPPLDNFADAPTVISPEPLLDIKPGSTR